MASEEGAAHDREAADRPRRRRGSSKRCLEIRGPVELRRISPLLPVVLCFSRSVVLLLLRTTC
jgi:hypothetical protein